MIGPGRPLGPSPSNAAWQWGWTPPSPNSHIYIIHSNSMAQKAKKDRAKANAATLNNMHLESLLVNGFFLISHFLLGRPRSLVAYGLFAAPSLVCEYVLEKSGRPTYDAAGALKTSGEDLAAQGLTEYMFDVIWVTWAATVAVIAFGNWGWILWVVVPAYGAYLGSGLLGMGRQKLAQMQGADDAPQPQGNRRSRRTA